ncbi:hypothetical protein NQZ68_022644 [Dissostichus eleginoides]|nr:hypothetical protein NQZ68_022644 [Dissostichus eleginoides]
MHVLETIKANLSHRSFQVVNTKRQSLKSWLTPRRTVSVGLTDREIERQGIPPMAAARGSHYSLQRNDGEAKE